MMVYYELKKILSKTSNKIAVICLACLLFLVCFFAISGVDYVNENGETEHGIAAAEKLRERKKEWTGLLTEEKIRQVIEANTAINQTEESRSADIRKIILHMAGNRGFLISVCFWYIVMENSGTMTIICRIPLCRRMPLCFT